jgi:hypothetical protein
MSKRRNKNVTSPVETILVGTGNQALATATNALAGSGSALNIADGQLGVLSADHKGTETFGHFITAGRTAIQVGAIQVAQGTPKSNAIQTVNAWKYDHPAVVTSGIIEPDKIISVSSSRFALGRLNIRRVQTGTPVADTEYGAFVTLRSVRRDRMFNKADDVIIASAITPGAATDMKDWLLQNIAYKFNTHSTLITGSKPFVVLGIKFAGGSGTVIGTLAAGTNVNFMTANGVTYQIPMTSETIASLTAAVTAVAGIATATIEVIDLATAGNAAKIDELLVVGLNESLSQAFDDIAQTKVRARIDFKDNLTTTITQLVAPVETRNGGREWAIRDSHRSKLFRFNLQNHPIDGEFFINPYSYINESLNYTSTIIEYYDSETVISGATHEPKVCTILLPCAVSNPTANVNTGYTIATTATTTVTALNNSLGAWLSSASDTYNRIQYLDGATKAAPFI